MATEFVFSMEDKPGAFAEIAKALGDRGINISGVAGLSAKGTGLIRLVTDDSDAAEDALNEANIPHGTREVLLLKMTDKPGELARYTEALGIEGVNLSTLYVTMDRFQVIDCDNLAIARDIASKLGILQE